jgi:hypothetical protein
MIAYLNVNLIVRFFAMFIYLFFNFNVNLIVLLFSLLAYFNGYVLGCGTLGSTRFEPTCFICATHVSRVGSKLSLIGQSQSDRENVVMKRCSVRIRPQFRWHNPNVLR